MPLTFTEYSLYPQGMCTECQFPLVNDGRKLFFRFPEAGHRRKDIYIVIDDELNLSPFKNGSHLTTPVRGVDRLFGIPHEASAIVVDRSEMILPEISLPGYTHPVRFPDGYNTTVTLNLSLNATVCCRDSAQLASEFVLGNLENPEEKLRATLRSCATRSAASLIPSAVSRNFQDPLELLNEVAHLKEQMEQDIADRMQAALPWAMLSGCEVNLQVNNEEELVRMSNRMLEELKLRMTRLYEAMLKSFGERPITPELGQIVLGYEQSHPGADVKELTEFCLNLKKMNEHFTASMLLQMAQDLGQLPNQNGGARRALFP